jgi:soluble lytic murein transglycosylase-like protein
MVRVPGLAKATLALGLACLVSACGGRTGSPLVPATFTEPYAPPGSPADPWGPYVHEASSRFLVPEVYVREVMRRESGGRQWLYGRPITSRAGAMGLMQLMPKTWRELRDRLCLGPDPYEPRDNILAGTAYIRELDDRFGFPAFLVAYNAGPSRLVEYYARRRTLPDETVRYVEAVAPRIYRVSGAAVRRIPSWHRPGVAVILAPERPLRSMRRTLPQRRHPQWRS